MPRSPRAIVPEESKETSAWSAIVLMASSVAGFALLALFLVNNHEWTDALLARLPSAGGALRLANDGIVAEQLRIIDVRTEHMTLADRSVALLLEATVVNDAAFPVRGIVIAVEGFRDGKKIADGEGTCGKNVSDRLIKRLSRDEVTALMSLETAQSQLLESGARTGCQVALVQLRTEVDEVTYRVASAEAEAGHAAVSRETSSEESRGPDRRAAE